MPTAEMWHWSDVSDCLSGASKVQCMSIWSSCALCISHDSPKMMSTPSTRADNTRVCLIAYALHGNCYAACNWKSSCWFTISSMDLQAQLSGLQLELFRKSSANKHLRRARVHHCNCLCTIYARIKAHICRVHAGTQRERSRWTWSLKPRLQGCLKSCLYVLSV